MSNPNPNHAQPVQSRSPVDLPGRTPLVSMFPLHMDPPAAPTRPEARTTPHPDAMHGGK